MLDVYEKSPDLCKVSLNFSKESNQWTFQVLVKAGR